MMTAKSAEEYEQWAEADLCHMPTSLGYDQVALQQGRSICNSRLDADTSAEVIKGITRPIPLIAANMSTVTSAAFCIELYQLGALGVMHRALPHNELLRSVTRISEECAIVPVAVGVDKSSPDVIEGLVNAGANVIVVDIAHGYSSKCIALGKWVKNKYKHVSVVLGNTTNLKMLEECWCFCDALKVGIAQGLACETKNTAGCTEKQFTAVFKFKRMAKYYGIPIIADGGIREPADFVKALAAGANSAMAGSIFARCPSSAAEIESVNDVQMKVYAGMASRYVQDRWKGGLKSGTCPEGKTTYLPIGEGVDKLLERYQGALRSGITYVGAKTVLQLQEKARFVRFD